ncbi:MAG: AAA family ATPase [Planctomycetota bacterium]
MGKVDLYDEGISQDRFSPPAPKTPQSLAETGLTLGFIADLVLKTLFTRGSMLGIELSRLCALPFKILEEALIFLKDEKCVEISGGDLIGTVSYRFTLTEFGRQRARDAMETLAYVGPAPVQLETYIQQTYRQMVTGIPITREGIKSAFSHLIITDEMIDTVGPAIVSGKAVFIYGPPGTGKTSIARAVGDYMNNSGGEIYVPHAIMAEDGVVTVFDPIVHRPLEDESDGIGPNTQALVRRLLNEDSQDPRWVKIRRPVIITGGELTLDMLDLRYSSTKNVYQAPLHIKANGGIFLIDDFGRQLCSPRELLNRWILPLEDRHDFLTLASGKKFMVPFEQLIIFSTNLDPSDLVDDAFLRRIRHKIGIDAPDRKLYEDIFNLYCRKLRLNESPESVDYLFERYYSNGRISRPSDARDLLEIVVSICRFKGEEPHLDRALMVEASRQFIAEF